MRAYFAPPTLASAFVPLAGILYLYYVWFFTYFFMLQRYVHILSPSLFWPTTMPRSPFLWALYIPFWQKAEGWRLRLPLASMINEGWEDVGLVMSFNHLSIQQTSSGDRFWIKSSEFNRGSGSSRWAQFRYRASNVPHGNTHVSLLVANL